LNAVTVLKREDPLMKKRTATQRQGKSAPARKDNPEVRKVVRGLRNLVKKVVLGTTETVNAWGIPTFEKGQPFCFYMVGKRHVTCGFHYGTSLRDPHKLLEGTGKNLRHVKLFEVEDLRRKGLRELLREAAKLKGKPTLPGMAGKRATR
jgi:hypothetical protein